MRRSVLLLRTALAVFVLLGTAACYAYQPLATAPSPGDKVRARLSVEAAVRRSRMMGEQVDAVAGEVTSVDDDGGVSLLVTIQPTLQQQARRERFTQTVPLAAADIEAMEIRRLSKVRTGILAAGIVAIASVAVQRTVTGGSEGTGDGGNGTGFSLVVGLIPIFGGR